MHLVRLYTPRAVWVTVFEARLEKVIQHPCSLEEGFFPRVRVKERKNSSCNIAYSGDTEPFPSRNISNSHSGPIQQKETGEEA